MVSIAAAVARIKEDPRVAIEVSVAQGVCEELGMQWMETSLTPPVTLSLLAQQVLLGNVSNPELVRAAGMDVTAAAYCTAKGRLPLEAVSQMSRRVCDAAERSAGVQHQWLGHDTWHLDGSTTSMPDTPQLQKEFGQPTGQAKGCGFPMAHILCLFGAVTGLIRDLIISPLYTHDLSQTPLIHPSLRAGAVVIADAAFGSFFHLAALSAGSVFGVFPSHQKRIVSFRPHRSFNQPGNKPLKGRPTSRWLKGLGHLDQLVEYFKPATRPDWMSQEEYDAAPASLIVREIRRKVRVNPWRSQVVVIVTTLLDARKYPADEVVALSKQRWNVEVNLRHLKTTMGMEVLRCQTVEGVKKELWAFTLIYNLARVIMMEAAERQSVPLDRISFADALYWMRHAKPGDPMPDLIVNPHRPGRVEPRVIKRRPKKYEWMTQPREVLRKALRRRK
jgi:hypothetical protein